MGNVTSLRGTTDPQSCVVGDHVYLTLSHTELVNVVEALHDKGASALEQRLARILRSMSKEANARAGQGRAVLRTRRVFADEQGELTHVSRSP